MYVYIHAFIYIYGGGGGGSENDETIGWTGKERRRTKFSCQK